MQQQLLLTDPWGFDSHSHKVHHSTNQGIIVLVQWSFIACKSKKKKSTLSPVELEVSSPVA